MALLQTGKNMLDVASRLTDTSFFIHLNSINAADDAIANDAKYHLKCWVVKQRESATSVTEPQEIEKLSQVINDIELINVIENELRHLKQYSI